MKLMRKVANTQGVLGVVVGLSCLSGVAHAQIASPLPTPKEKAWTIADIRAMANSIRESGYGTLADYNEAVAASPNDASVYCNRGAYYREQKQYDKAIADYQKAAKLDPENIEPHLELIEIYKEQKNVAQALAEYGKAIVLELALKPLKTGSLRARGDYFMKLGRDAEALADYNKAVMLQPTNTSTYLYRALFFRSRNQLDKALLDYNKMVEIDPKTVFHLQWQGELLNEIKRYQDAIGSFTKALAIEPKNAEALDGLGIAYTGTASYQLAIDSFNKALALTPNSSITYLNRGLAYLGIGYLNGKALEDLNTSIALDENSRNDVSTMSLQDTLRANSSRAQAYFHRSLLLARGFNSHPSLKEAAPIAADVTKAVQLDPSLTIEYSKRAQIMTSHSTVFVEERYGAVALLAGLASAKPNDSQILAQLGDAQVALSRYEIAISCYSKALQIDPKNAVYYANRGLIHVKTKAWAAAQADLNRSIALDPKLGVPFVYRALLTLDQGKEMTLPTKTRDDAILDIVKALQLNATLVDSIIAFANEYSKDILKRDKGVALISGIAQTSPRDVNVLVKLGDFQSNNMQSADAVANYTKALQIDAKSTAALSGRAKAYFGYSRPYNDVKLPLAIADWKSYLVLKPNDIDAMQQMGICQYNALQTADGVTTFRKLVKANTSNAYAHLMLGLGLAIQGDETGATTEVKAYVTKATPDDLEKAKGNIVSATNHYPTNAILKTIHDLIPKAPKVPKIYYV